MTEPNVSGLRVIVTDADTRVGLYVIRALGRAGCKVTAVSNEPEGRGVLGFSSRFASAHHRMSGAEYAPTLVEAIETLSATHDVVVPITTRSVGVVADHAERLQSRIRFYTPPPDVLLAANDKATTTRIAKEVGVPVPETYNRLDPATIEEWAKDNGVGFPLVIKFADEMRTDLWRPQDRYRIVHSITELGREYRRMHQAGPFPMVQEYVVGEGRGFFALADESGQPVVSFCHRRLREYPISGGPSTLCESVHDTALVDLGTRILTALKLKGVSMVEFKYDPAKNQYRFLEINARFWGSLPLALQCGVNFPLYQVQMAMGMAPTATHSYRAGVRMRFLFTDLLAARDHWRLKKDAGSALRYVRELLSPSIRDGLITMDDIKPVMTYFLSRLGR